MPCKQFVFACSRSKSNLKDKVTEKRPRKLNRFPSCSHWLQAPVLIFYWISPPFVFKNKMVFLLLLWIMARIKILNYLSPLQTSKCE